MSLFLKLYRKEGGFWWGCESIKLEPCLKLRKINYLSDINAFLLRGRAIKKAWTDLEFGLVGGQELKSLLDGQKIEEKKADFRDTPAIPQGESGKCSDPHRSCSLLGR